MVLTVRRALIIFPYHEVLRGPGMRISHLQATVTTRPESDPIG